MRPVLRLFSDSASVSNSSALESCERSPVCRTNDGGVGSALTLAIASRSVAVTSGFASLLNPMWLSLICTKLSSPFIWPILCCRTSLRAKDFRTPPCSTHRVPVPAQAMHFRNPRRSTPSSSRFFSIKFDIYSLLRSDLRWPNDRLCCVHPSRLPLPAKYSRNSRLDSAPTDAFREGEDSPMIGTDASDSAHDNRSDRNAR